MGSVTEDDLWQIGRCLDAALKGSFFEDWEFETLIGAKRAQVEAIAAAWPNGSDADEVDLVVSNVLVNLLGYSHHREDDLCRLTGASMPELGRLLETWKSHREPTNDHEALGNFPKHYSGEHAPAGVIEAQSRLMPALLDGSHPFLSALRTQYAHSTIQSVELTGAGFYVDFTVPGNLPATDPLSFSGGNAVLSLDTSPLGAGCVLFVRDGYLATLEVYTWGDDGWKEETVLTGITDVISPIPS